MTNSRQCLPECRVLTLAEIWPFETKPDYISEYSWTEVMIEDHAEGCPVLERVRERGRQLAKDHGW